MLGHEAIVAANGKEAFAQWKMGQRQGRSFDLAILDLTIVGGTGGLDTVACIHKEDPHFRAIASSGYATDPVMANFRSYGFDACLTKPYSIEDLESVLAEVMRQEEKS
jgi:CheY-like chemotaxis protein